MSDHLGQIMRQFCQKSFQNCSFFIALLSLMAFCIPPHFSTHLMFDEKNINVQWNVLIRNIETTDAGYPPLAMLVLL